MIRKIAIVLGLAAIHGGLCYGVTVLTLAATGSAAYATRPGIWTKALIAASKLLYMPVLGLGLFPRQWAPGDMIIIPLAVNSLIWGLGIYVMGSLILKCFQTK